MGGTARNRANVVLDSGVGSTAPIVAALVLVEGDGNLLMKVSNKAVQKAVEIVTNPSWKKLLEGCEYEHHCC